jgi:hypothetical protein
VTALAPSGCVNAQTCLSTQWIGGQVDGADPQVLHPRYLSFNTPVGMEADKQCGRAVLSDVHLEGASSDQVFPNECASADPSYGVNEKALEFLFFDLSSCVQNDGQPPRPPTVK